ncbi:MAG: hypothetical protein JO184_05615 [Gammaproteobacteria bacterium]|nr:hypothetical protein [Gammaproteobacteria bacterium]MBV8405786.1 hypothetical protein [Gammaproteobacteria bacterium]
MESIKRPLHPESPPEPAIAEELENVTIRVVRLDQLARTQPPQPLPPVVARGPSVPAPAAATPPAVRTPAAPPARPASTPAVRAPAAPAARPASTLAVRAPAAPVARPTPTSAARAPDASPARPAPTPAARAPAAPAAGPAPAPAPAPRPPAAPAERPTPAPAPRGEIRGAATPAARPAAPTEPAKRKRTLTWSRVGFIALVVVLYLGWTMPTERYITPTRGFGYALGIIGGSLMLVLLLYSARKHFRWLRFLGPTPSWFKFHMVLGIVGPLCILFHSNFKTGAANSNVALFCMLTVAGSGFIGRYLYAHIHSGLYGRKLHLGELQESAFGLREVSGSVSFLPDLVARLEVAEKRLLASGPHLSMLGFLKPLVVRVASIKARWQLHGYVRRGLRANARTNHVIAAESKRLRRTANGYIDRRLAATRRVAEFQGYERLFSLWHALHIPLIFMLIIAAVVHVIAVNVY